MDAEDAFWLASPFEPDKEHGLTTLQADRYLLQKAAERWSPRPLPCSDVQGTYQVRCSLPPLQYRDAARLQARCWLAVQVVKLSGKLWAADGHAFFRADFTVTSSVTDTTASGARVQTGLQVSSCPARAVQPGASNALSECSLPCRCWY